MPGLTLILETAALILAAYLIGCAVGYALRLILFAARGRRHVTAPTPVAPPPVETRRPRSPAARLAAAASNDELPGTPRVKRAPAAASAPRPPALAAPRDGRPDNLKQIKGIGPKIEASLQALGIFHFDQIAAWTKADADWIDSQLGFKGRVRRERWIEQAAELARVAA